MSRFPTFPRRRPTGEKIVKAFARPGTEPPPLADAAAKIADAKRDGRRVDCVGPAPQQPRPKA